MASTNFTYNPTTGSGNTNVSVAPVGQNSGTADKNTTLTFSDGNTSKNVTIKQLYRPWFSLASGNIPATGGTKNITIHTEYPISFEGRGGELEGSWVHIMSGNTDYSDGSIIPSGINDNSLVISADTNTGVTRAVAIAMCHYVNGVKQSYAQSDGFTITQDSGASQYETVPVTVTLSNVPRTGTYNIAVDVTSYDSETDGLTLTLSNSVTEGYGDVDVKLNPGGTTSLVVSVTPTRASGVTVTGLEANITFDYGNDSQYEADVELGDTAVFNTTYQAEEEILLDLDISLII